ESCSWNVSAAAWAGLANAPRQATAPVRAAMRVMVVRNVVMGSPGLIGVVGREPMCPPAAGAATSGVTRGGHDGVTLAGEHDPAQGTHTHVGREELPPPTGPTVRSVH